MIFTLLGRFRQNKIPNQNELRGNTADVYGISCPVKFAFTTVEILGIFMVVGLDGATVVNPFNTFSTVLFGPQPMVPHTGDLNLHFYVSSFLRIIHTNLHFYVSSFFGTPSLTLQIPWLASQTHWAQIL